MSLLMLRPVIAAAFLAIPLRIVAADLHVDSDRQLQASAAYALDVRWASRSSIAVTTMDDGVLEVDIHDPTHVRNIAYPHVDRARCYTCSMLGLSDRYLATAF